MKKSFHLLCPAIILLCYSCKTAKPAFDPDRKYSPGQLRQDYRLFRNILEDSHPSLYWYTPKDSLDRCFDQGYARIRDSMNELQFRALLSYTISRIDCGHTSIRYSRAYSGWLDTAKTRQFPLMVKCWGDTMVITTNLNLRDSLLKRGVIVTRINGRTVPQLMDTLFNYVVTDGYSRTGKYQVLSTGLSFGNWYKCVFGLPDVFDIGYLDSTFTERRVLVPPYDPRADTGRRAWGRINHAGEQGRRHRKLTDLFMTRNLQVDTVGHTAYMSLNTFTHGNKLRGFFRHSFKALEKDHISHLVIDVRSNGGGDATLSTLLTRYLADKKFKIADSLYAVSRHSRYDRYIEKSDLYRLMMLFVTHKKSDGHYHFGYFERHYFHPKRNHHFDGEVYILIGGNSFSATSLFAGTLKGQKNITLVGEETGGGAYGNTAWMIPDAELPNTGIRFRLPKFRLVVNREYARDGRGVLPDVQALPSVEAIGRGIDFKAEKVKELIRLHAAEIK